VLHLEQLAKKEPVIYEDLLETPILNTIGECFHAPMLPFLRAGILNPLGDCAYIIDLSYCLDLVLPESLAGDTARTILKGDPEPGLRYREAEKREDALASAVEDVHLQDFIKEGEAVVDSGIQTGTESLDIRDTSDVNADSSSCDESDSQDSCYEDEIDYDLEAWVAAVDVKLYKRYGKGMLDLFDPDKLGDAKPRWTTTNPPKPHREYIEIESDQSRLTQSGRAYLTSQGLAPTKPESSAYEKDFTTSSSNIGTTARGEDVDTEEMIDHPSFKVTKKQLILASRLLGADSREDAGQVRWDDIVKVSLYPLYVMIVLTEP
jgi:hypothetical protein